MHFESDKLLENHLVQQNQQLRDEKQLSDFYYRDLLDLASCGILMYTLPGYQIVHMNKEAMRIYGLKNFEQAQKEFGQIVSNVEYFDANAKRKLAHLREHNGAVDYTCIIHGLQGEQIPILARTVNKETLGEETAVITTFLDISEKLYPKKKSSAYVVFKINWNVHWWNHKKTLELSLQLPNCIKRFFMRTL